MTNQVRLSLSIINLAHRKDRREHAIRELSKIGIEANNLFFTAKHTPELGQLGCALSHGMALANLLYSSTSDIFLVLEDDFVIRDLAFFQSDLKRVLSWDGWDVFLLGHNLALPLASSNLPPFQRVINAQTTSGYIVKRQFAPTLIELFFRSAELLRGLALTFETSRVPARRSFACDILWKELQIKYRFITKFPAIIGQDAGFSDIEKRDVSYKC